MKKQPPEAFYKKVFLKLPQNLRENTYVWNFHKIYTKRPVSESFFNKKDPLAQMFF